MAERIVIDPITRIEGHLRIEAKLDSDNVITEAYSSGTMVRGIEKILLGRDPRDAWAFTQRACGVCTTVHAFASIRAVEDALAIRIPHAANLLRNLMVAQQYVHDHVMHFYHLHALDWVDVTGVLGADPQATAALQQSLSPWPNASAGYFADVQAKVKAIVDSGQLSIFANGYWGHPAYVLPPEVNLLAVAHYLEALDWQKDVTKIHTILGGKNPHPNFVVGGVPIPIDLNGELSLNAERLSIIGASIGKMVAFVEQVYLPDLLAVGGIYLKDDAYFSTHALLGEGLKNFLTWGEFPGDDPLDTRAYLIPRAMILNRDLANVQEPDPRDTQRMLEYIGHSWYRYAAGDGVGLPPWKGETDLNYTGPRPPYDLLNVDGKYSWLKAPRYGDQAMEVGPLARVLALYASGNTEVKELAGRAVARLNAVSGRELPFPDVLFTTLGRTAARCLETVVIAHAMQSMYSSLIDAIKAGNTDTWSGAKWEPATWPAHAEGFGFMEAPRGALGHWIVIDGGKIANYQMVVPTTWNASPRDGSGNPGAYEAALVGTKLADPTKPLEVLRVIHSFDPCMACAIHLTDARGGDLGEVGIGLNVCLR
jgi:hydrogenase large subunit